MNWTAIIPAIISVGSALSIAVGHPAIGAVLTDPSTATNVTAVITGLAALISAFMPAVHKPA